MSRLRGQISAEAAASANKPPAALTWQRVKLGRRPPRRGREGTRSAEGINPITESILSQTHLAQAFSTPAILASGCLAAHLVSQLSWASPVVVGEQQEQHQNHQHLHLHQQQQQDELRPQMAAMQGGTALASNNAEQQQSLADWWNEYWSRQPFPSGYTQSSITLLACLITTIMFLIVVGNLLVCIAIFTEKSLKPTQNWFIASLAVSDMLLGLVVMPFSLARELMGFWVFGPLWCDIHEAIDVLLTTASINTLCLISLDRYWSITQAVNYLKKRTPRRGAFMIAFVWVFSAAVSLPPLFGWKKQSPTITVANNTAPASRAKQAASDNRTRRDAHLLEEARLGQLARPQLSAQQLARAHQNLLTIQQPSSSHQSPQYLSSTEPTYLDSYLDLQMEQQQQQQQSSIMTAPTTDQLPAQIATATTEYPSCQLSDDVGYVLYSALGSFYIPCAVMVFTYIKIFLAARSRARRAISKQSRAANKRQKQAHQAAKQAEGQLSAGLLSQRLQSIQKPAGEQAPVTMKGKIVIVERKKSLAASSLAPLTINVHESADESKCTGVNPEGVASPVIERLQQQQRLELEKGDTMEPCTLTTSQAKQASPSALQGAGEEANERASNDSSMITVMTASMGDVPVTRFSLKSRRAPDAGQEEAEGAAAASNKAAASLLRAISQAGGAEEQRRLLSEILVDAEQGSDADSSNSSASGRPPANEQVAGHANVKDSLNGESGRPVEAAASEEEEDDEDEEESGPDLGNATKETCFMTVEEDSDLFDRQQQPASKAIVLLAAGQQGQSSVRSQKRAYNLGKTQGILMTMVPPGRPTNCAPASNQHSICNNVTCNRTNTRSASSYCGSNMTINDEDMDMDCLADEEPLTDDCNGYSVSCADDQYCPADASSCAHCRECEQEQGRRRRHLSLSDSPASARTHQHRQGQQQQQQRSASANQAATGSRNRQEPLESHSLAGDDQLSLTEYRSNEDSSSIVGHDVLDATDTRPSSKKRQDQEQQAVGEQSNGRKKSSSIGFRLRLGSSAQGGQTGGLLALALSQQQQQTGNQQQAGGRNLKALRQNFFLKLNQLTAKSAAKQEAKSSKKNNQASPTGKSSAHSSGTSYEPSVDCATTSNVHSMDYHQETTIDDFDHSTSASSHKNAARQAGQGLRWQSSVDSSGKTRQVELASGKQLGQTDAGRPEPEAADHPVAEPKGTERALLLRRPEERDQKHLLSADLRSPVSDLCPAGQGQLKAPLDSGRLQTRTQTGQVMNRSSTMMSSGGNTVAGSAVSSRAYLASDNERHKRKLAKARERRATLILGLIMAAFICSWLPFFSFYVMRALCNVCREYIPPRFEAFIFWMGYCNSAINPIIYTIFNRDFRKAFRKILFKCL